MFSCLHFERSSNLFLSSWVETFSERQSRHRLLVLLYDGLGFKMNQETYGAVPVCRFVLQLNFDSVEFFSYLRLLKIIFALNIFVSMVLLLVLCRILCQVVGHFFLFLSEKPAIQHLSSSYYGFYNPMQHNLFKYSIQLTCKFDSTLRLSLILSYLLNSFFTQ